MNNKVITIGKKRVGEGRPVFIVAEAGVNHNGKLSLARKLIDAAARAGADAIKFQTFSPDELITKTARKAAYQRTRAKQRESQYAMLQKLALPREDHRALKSYAEKKGLIFLSTPFSLSDAHFLKKLGVPAIKVSSSDANNTPFLSGIAGWNLPILLSTGMSDMAGVKESVAVLRKSGNRRIVVLQCTTNYPAPLHEANVRAIQTLKNELGTVVGFSDHTKGFEAALAAVALGASLIEKHLTLDKRLPGPDHKTSLSPSEFREFVRRIRNTEKAFGTGKKVPFASERKIARAARKSIVTLVPIRTGEIFTEENLGIKRPGTGLSPKEYGHVLRARATRDIPPDRLLRKTDYEA